MHRFPLGCLLVAVYTSSAFPFWQCNS